mmetsp:Transcript_19040/g.36863  ORF Transcript_19040/g.36863 Transcript_19040/m.36863 type:complete len:282 (-) Transcript_19040:1260-2105(-)
MHDRSPFPLPTRLRDNFASAGARRGCRVSTWVLLLTPFRSPDSVGVCFRCVELPHLPLFHPPLSRPCCCYKEKRRETDVLTPFAERRSGILDFRDQNCSHQQQQHHQQQQLHQNRHRYLHPHQQQHDHHPENLSSHPRHEWEDLQLQSAGLLAGPLLRHAHPPPPPSLQSPHFSPPHFVRSPTPHPHRRLRNRATLLLLLSPLVLPEMISSLTTLQPSRRPRCPPLHFYLHLRFQWPHRQKTSAPHVHHHSPYSPHQSRDPPRHCRWVPCCRYKCLQLLHP